MAKSCKHQHNSLGATLEGVDVDGIWNFRGLPYGHVAERFAAPSAAVPLSGHVNCTEFGPLCPQLQIDARHLLRIPPDIAFDEESYDEFKCLNLDIAVPTSAANAGAKLPVLIWIYGTFLQQHFKDVRGFDSTCRRFSGHFFWESTF